MKPPSTNLIDQSDLQGAATSFRPGMNASSDDSVASLLQHHLPTPLYQNPNSTLGVRALYPFNIPQTTHQPAHLSNLGSADVPESIDSAVVQDEIVKRDIFPSDTDQATETAQDSNPSHLGSQARSSSILNSDDWMMEFLVTTLFLPYKSRTTLMLIIRNANILRTMFRFSLQGRTPELVAPEPRRGHCLAGPLQWTATQAPRDKRGFPSLMVRVLRLTKFLTFKLTLSLLLIS